MRLAFLHTSSSHVTRFSNIVAAIGTNQDVEHHVYEALLDTVQHTGQIDVLGFRNAVAKIKQDGAKVIICTCSSYGSLCNVEEHIYRIDQPIAAYLVDQYSHIAIAYTLSSTKDTSLHLLQQEAHQRCQSITVKLIDCTSCWQWFETNQIEQYNTDIAEHIRSHPGTFEAVLLAQASMEGALPLLSDEAFQVYSSPAFGVRRLLTLVQNCKY